MVKHHHKMVKGIQTYVTHEGSGKGLRPEMVATALSDLAEDDAVFTVDTGMCNVWGARYLQMKPGRRILASFSHGSMANAMPQAIGAKVGSPDRQVVALCGDGGFIDADGRAAHRGRPRHPGQADGLQQLHAGHGPRGDDGGRLPAVGHRREEPRLRRAWPRPLVMHGERVENAADIRPAIERAFAHPGPALIDFVTDPRALAVPPHTTIEEVKGFALTTGKLVFSGDFAEAWGQAEVQHPRRRPGPLTRTGGFAPAREPPGEEWPC